MNKVSQHNTLLLHENRMAVSTFRGRNIKAKHTFNPLKTDKVKVLVLPFVPRYSKRQFFERSQPSPVCPYGKSLG
jgi:hypothetical protein